MPAGIQFVKVHIFVQFDQFIVFKVKKKKKEYSNVHRYCFSIFSANLEQVLPLSRETLTCSNSTVEAPDKKCEICSKLTLKPPERRQSFFRKFLTAKSRSLFSKKAPTSPFYSVSTVDFEQVIACWVEVHILSVGRSHEVSIFDLNKILTFVKKSNKSAINNIDRYLIIE